MDAFGQLMMLQGLQQAQAAAEQTKLTNSIAKEQLDWGKQQWEEDKNRTQPIIDQMVAGAKQSNDFAKQNQDFYTSTYQPLQKDYADQALKYNSQDYQELRAGQAGATAAQSFAASKAAAEQNLKDFGVNPSSPRYMSSSLLGHLASAAGITGAENTERANVQSEGLQLENQAIGHGMNTAGLANQSYNTGINAGNSAVSNTLANTASGASVMGTAPQYYGLGNQAMSNWGNSINSNYANYMQGYQADQARSAARTNAIGSALGLAGGIGVQAAMGRFMPTAVPHQAAGGTVPDQASPTDGAAVDDVPAQLTAGEFVIPKAAVEWFGQKHFHQLIDKANKERQQMTAQSGAVPEMGPGSDQPPAFVSRSQPQAALPVG